MSEPTPNDKKMMESLGTYWNKAVANQWQASPEQHLRKFVDQLRKDGLHPDLLLPMAIRHGAMQNEFSRSSMATFTALLSMVVNVALGLVLYLTGIAVWQVSAIFGLYAVWNIVSMVRNYRTAVRVGGFKK